MPEEYSQEDMNRALFASLITMLSTSAMQQLGKIVNPMTNKAEISLEGAQLTIDMLSMLRERTRGNLDETEQKMLDDILASLQMNYVQVSESETAKPEPGGAEPKEQPDEKVDAPGPDTAGEGNRDNDGESRERKFHKSYGDG